MEFLIQLAIAFGICAFLDPLVQTLKGVYIRNAAHIVIFLGTMIILKLVT